MTVEHEAPARRGDRTRAAILAAARDRFAADGYAKATIRAIATQAGIDPSMVIRYFGSKEKLLAAAADFDLELPDLSGVPLPQWGARIARHVVWRWEQDDMLVALLRVAATHDAAAARGREILANQVEPLVAAVEPDPALVRLRAGLIASQILGLTLARYIMRLPPVGGLTIDDVEVWVGPVLQHYLTGQPGQLVT